MQDSIKELAIKTVQCLKYEGVKATSDKIKTYLGFMQQRKNIENIYADVLFINGCYLQHPARYRVTHQREQLLAKNIVSSEVFYTELTMDFVKKYRLFVFYRCPYTDTIGEFIAMAKKLNKKVLFDIDDLLFDEKYTETIDYIKTMSQRDKDDYYNGIRLMQKTLKLCDGATTSTETLAEELRKYVPYVYINRNLASERMYQLSEEAMINKVNGEKNESISIGYFSGSITHNQDFEMILPAIIKILNKYANVKLSLVGDITLPDELLVFKERIVFNKFVEWEKLPELIASVDINIAPLVDTLFNRAKSENKWVEAALVKVPTVASDVGAFTRMIEHNKTGLLCKSVDEWYDALSRLIEDATYREKIAEDAYQYATEHCVTMTKSAEYAAFIKEEFSTNLFMVLPMTQIAGGVLVALRHCTYLIEQGYDVTILNEGCEDTDYLSIYGYSIPVLNKREIGIFGSIDKAVGTLWSTMDFVVNYGNIKERFYFVQNYETNFYKPGEYFRCKAEQTYSPTANVRFITISKWCENWLKDKYDVACAFAPNGIETEKFYPVKREFKGKIRILIEGNSNDYYKNVDESFHIVDRLDKDKFEIWYMSYQGKPKNGYYVDNFMHKVPYDEVPNIYRQCDILIKTSILESFSYPPLEMMATGGFVVVVPNGGNIEYLVDNENCLMYPQGNIDEALKCIERIVNDEQLREKMYVKGLETANSRDWNKIKEDILNMYK